MARHGTVPCGIYTVHGMGLRGRGFRAGSEPCFEAIEEISRAVLGALAVRSQFIQGLLKVQLQYASSSLKVYSVCVKGTLWYFNFFERYCSYRIGRMGWLGRVVGAEEATKLLFCTCAVRVSLLQPPCFEVCV